jgi:hypothetical protein
VFQLRTYRCIAVNGSFGPTSDINHAAAMARGDSDPDVC